MPAPRLRIPMIVTLAILCCPPLYAVATLHFNLVGKGAQGEATVRLVGPGGATQTMQSQESEFTVIPEGEAGEYEVTITNDGRSASQKVAVPETGRVEVIYDGTTIQASELSVVEHITVTARRVEESLQQVPVAVSAFTQKDLDRQHVEDIQQISYATPNLWMEPNTGLSNGARAAIRGIGEDESFFSADTPVGIYVDDVYIPRQNGAQFSLFDVERIEVLRGPQGTLFGRNTSAGAIRLITRKPGNVFKAHVEATLGDYQRADLKGAVTNPFSNGRGSFEIAGITRNRDGFDTNLVNGKDVGKQEVWGGRASLSLLPSDKVDVLIVADKVEDTSDPGFGVRMSPQPPLNSSGYGVGRPKLDQQYDGDSDVHTFRSDLTDPINDINMRGLAGTVTWQASESLLLKSVSSARKLDHELLIDVDGADTCFGLPLPCFHLYQNQGQDQWSQELQLQGTTPKVDWIGGLYYFHEKNEQRTENIILAPFGANNYWDAGLMTDSYAAYATGTFRVNERLNFSVGGRYTEDDKDFDTKVFHPDGSPLLACLGPDGTIVDGSAPCDASDPPGSTTVPVEKELSNTWSKFTPRVTLDYAVTGDALLYLNYAKGFKSGGYDGRVNAASTVLPLEPIDPEEVTTYELGLKSDWAHNRVRFNATGFYNEFDNLQGTGTDINGNFKRFNVGDLKTQGAEFETRFVPADGLEIQAMLSLLDTKYTSIRFDQATDCGPFGTGDADLELKFAPHTSYRAGVDYRLPDQMASGFWSFGGQFVHKSSFWHTSCNALVGSSVGYDLADAHVTWERPGGRWWVNLGVENLTNEDYIAGSITIPGLFYSAAYFNPPRRVTLSVRFAL